MKPNHRGEIMNVFWVIQIQSASLLHVIGQPVAPAVKNVRSRLIGRLGLDILCISLTVQDERCGDEVENSHGLKGTESWEREQFFIRQSP
jgi:hypothetical protein